jgi:hypothetical protein
MTGKDYFILGCKLFGVYSLFMGVPLLITVVPGFFPPENLGDMQNVYTATIIVSLLIPIIYIVGGIYLLRGADHLYQYVYPEGTSSEIDIEGEFTLFIKMLGVYLIVSYFPVLLRTISSYFVYTNAPGGFDMMHERQFSYLNAASSIWGVAFGLYLLIGGKYIVNLALSKIKTSGEIEKD